MGREGRKGREGRESREDREGEGKREEGSLFRLLNKVV